MSATNDNNYKNLDYLKEGLSLSERFYQLEGKRPRILIGGTIDPLSKFMNEICNSLADMGYDVDLSPKAKTLNNLANQGLENDVDVVLICSDKCFSFRELLDFQHQVFSNQPDLTLSFMATNSACISMLKGQLDQWMLFRSETSSYKIGYSLLNHLLSSS